MAHAPSVLGRLHSHLPWVLALSLQLLLCLISLESVLFWDTIQLASRHAAHFHFGEGFWLPERINSGNPPFMGGLVHLVWSLFGRELWITHLVTWPFLFANLILLHRIGRHVRPEASGWLPLLWLSVPVYAAQTTLVSPDVILVTGLLLILHGRYYPNRFWPVLGGVLLGLVSLRGSAILGVIFLWWVLDQRFRSRSWTLLPGVALAGLFYILHYKYFGWALVPPDSPWSGSFETTHSGSWLRMTGIWLWRMIDHGLIFLWLVILAAKPWKDRRFLMKPESLFLMLMIGLFAVFFIGFDGLNLHRYLLPVFLGAMIWAFTFGSWIRHNKGWLWIALLAGNLWPYPEGVSRGWDATLAWLPWTWHRQHVLAAMEEQGIDPSITASAFPNLGPFDELDLSGDQRAFLPLDSLSFANYFFFSNIFNDLKDQDLKSLRQWEPVAQSGSWPVRVVLLKKPDHALP